MTPMRHMEDLKVISATAMGIMLSYVQFLHFPTLNQLRWLVLLVALAYNLRRWYLLEKRNKINTMKTLQKLKDWYKVPGIFGIPKIFYLLVGAILLGVILNIIF